MHAQYNKKQAGLGEIERHIIDKMSFIGKSIIYASDLEKEFRYDKKKANLTLSRLCRKGWLQRLRAGVYRIIPLGSDTTDPIPEDAWVIAMELFSPCYISGWTAAEHWDLTEQVFNSTMVFTSRKQRTKDHIIAGLVYRTKAISEKDIFGVKKIWSSNKIVLIADIHKTIVDILDDPEIGGGGRHAVDIIRAYWQKKEADLEILIQYAGKLGSGAIFKRLGFIAEKVMHLPQDQLNELYSKINTGIIKFDPSGPNSGPISTRWGIRLNIPLSDLT